jgi:SAM-dependent methyltransferase
MKTQLEQIRDAYDLTVSQHARGVDPLSQVPASFKASPAFQAFMETPACNSANPENRAYLAPQAGMAFLDVGCSANLVNYRLDRWPSRYYGIDISPALIDAMRGFVEREAIEIGGLYVTAMDDLPFDDGSFDIASVIGVLEYWSLDYIEAALEELHRVLKADARVVLDIPNLDHPLVVTMMQLEAHLGRPVVPHPAEAFEAALTQDFVIDREDGTRVMRTYYVRARA